MYHILRETKNHIIAIQVEDYMSAQDYKTILPYLKCRIGQYGSIRILIELKNFKGVEMLGVIQSLPYIFKYMWHVEKEVFITNEDWINTWVNLFTPFVKTKIRCFPSAQREQAWKWLQK